MIGKIVCPDGCGLEFELSFFNKMHFIDFAMKQLGHKDICILSGPRCDKHNAQVNGVNNSAHKRGIAADIEYNGHAHLFILCVVCILSGIRRLGINFKEHFIHIDEGTEKDGYPTPCLFPYN